MTGPGTQQRNTGMCLDRVPVPCDILSALMEAGGVQQEYLVPAAQKSESTKPVRGINLQPSKLTLTVVPDPVVPYGLGLFGVGVPRWINNREDGGRGWDNFFFSFVPSRPCRL